jgi:chaperonin cofactor prefoldin
LSFNDYLHTPKNVIEVYTEVLEKQRERESKELDELKNKLGNK